MNEAEATADREAFRHVVAYLLGTDEGTEVFEALSRGALSAPVREVGMSYQQRWMDQGRAEGRAEGEAKGRAEVLLKLLRLRFAEPSAEVEARVREASIAELDRWVERVLSAESLDEIFA